MVWRGTLGREPWADTSVRYRADPGLAAAGTHGRHRWLVKFREPALDVLHKEACCTFALGTVGQPEHPITVEVIDKDAEALVGMRAFVSTRMLTGDRYAVAELTIVERRV